MQLKFLIISRSQSVKCEACKITRRRLVWVIAHLIISANFSLSQTFAWKLFWRQTKIFFCHDANVCSDQHMIVLRAIAIRLFLNRPQQARKALNIVGGAWKWCNVIDFYRRCCSCCESHAEWLRHHVWHCGANQISASRVTDKQQINGARSKKVLKAIRRLQRRKARDASPRHRQCARLNW